MARIKIPSEASSNPEVRTIFDEIKKVRKVVPAPYRVFSLLPHILQANWNKTKKISRNGNITLVLKEQIALAVSFASGCEFCIHVHEENLINKD